MAGIVLLHGCYGPNPYYLGPVVADGATDDAEGIGEVDDGSDAGNGSGDDDSGEAGGTGNSSDTEVGNCGDGIPEPGDLCFKVETVLTMRIQALAVGDFDLNGQIDLGVAAKDDLRVLFGDGSGGFPLQLDLSESEGDYPGAAVGDLDQDGYPDLLFSNHAADTVMVHASEGNKTFADPVALPVGDQPMGIALGLLDDDGWLDVVVADKGSDAVWVLVNQGFGQFTVPTNHSTGSDEPRRLALGHFDAGGTIDLAVANHNGEELSILLGLGGGQFQAAQTYPLAGMPRAIVADDFDLDGALDLALAISDRDLVEIAFGNGLGGFGGEHLEIEVGDQPVALAVVDLDNDGARDLVILNEDDGEVGVLFGDVGEPGEFLAHQTVVGLSNFGELEAIVVADLDGDGLADLVVGGEELRVLISNP